jgi:hypothetical protein
MGGGYVGQGLMYGQETVAADEAGQTAWSFTVGSSCTTAHPNVE